MLAADPQATSSRIRARIRDACVRPDGADPSLWGAGWLPAPHDA